MKGASSVDDAKEKPQTVADFLALAKPLVEEHVNAVESHGLYLRKNSGFDLVMGALYCRIIEAIRSTFILAEHGQNADAVVTARVALEHAMISASIALATDREKEAYIFIIRQWRHVKESNEKLAKHYPNAIPDNPIPDEEIESYVSQSDQHETSERLKAVVRQLDEKHSPNRSFFSWLFEVPYDAMSNYAHPRALGLRSFTPTFGEPFKISKTTKELLGINAIRCAMLALLLMCPAMLMAWDGGDLESKILPPLEDFLYSYGPDTDITDFEN
jgi:hypothetical protein